MKLTLGYVNIHDIQLSNESKVANGVLYVNPADITKLVLEDEHLASASVDVARPGESVRITPVKDVIEPRVKVEGNGGIFPGFMSKVDTVGSGKTLVLKGAAVVTTGRVVGFQEGIIDMCGIGSEYTPFSKTMNLVLTCEPVEGIPRHQHEEAIRIAGLKTATFIGELARNVKPDSEETFETYGLFEGAEKMPNLPKVGYVQMLQSQGLMHDTYVYGVDAKKTLSTLIDPLETMDGAILSGNCVSACDKNTTYHHLNNPVVADLLAQHGKTLNFAAMIITNENVYLADKERSSNWTQKLAKFLGLDGVVISQEGFGNPDTDLIMNCRKIEEAGVKTVIVTDEYAGRDGTSQSLADANVLADAAVTGGNANEVITIPKMDKVIGHLEFVDKIAGGWDKNTNPDGSIVIEIQAITGATNELGFSKLSAR
ncbi:MAG: glycine/sarcosine/betaine reductase component B subunit [Oscillospiraceae bacterium]